MKRVLCFLLLVVFVVSLLPAADGFAEKGEETDQIGTMPIPDWMMPDAGAVEDDGQSAGSSGTSVQSGYGSGLSLSGDSSQGSEMQSYTGEAQDDRYNDLVSPSLAVSGSGFWRIYEGMLVYEDAVTGEEEAAYPVADFCGKGESLVYISVASGTEDKGNLCLAVKDDESDSLRVTLREIWEDENAVELGEEQDVTGALGIFFDESVEWNEVSMFSCGQNLVIEALDPSFTMKLYRFAPETGELTQFGEQSLMMYAAGVPAQEKLLIISRDLENRDSLILEWMSTADGSVEQEKSIQVTSAINAGAFAYSAEENRLFFSINSTAYAVKLDGESRPEAIAALPGIPEELRLGAVAGDRYATLSEGGEQLLICDIHERLQATELRIADPLGEEAVAAAAKSFGVEHPGYTVAVTENTDEEGLLQALLNGSAEYDAFILTLDSAGYERLLAEGRLADLSENAVLSEAAEDMPDYLRTALVKEGKLCAFPLSSMALCQTLNVDAMQTLMGFSREQIPTDWTGFLKLLRKMGSKGVMTKNRDISIYGMDVPAEDFQFTVFNWLLQDVALWAKRYPSEIDRLQKILVPALEAYNRVDWYGLGLEPESFEETEEEEFFSADYAPPVENYVLMDSMPEIVVMDMNPGEEFWPLSLGDGERLISQTVSVICVNPESPNCEAALDFVEAVWEKTETAAKMSFCQSMTEPVLNEDYEDDLAYMEDLTLSYEKDLETAGDEMEKQLVQAQLEELRGFIEDYRENAYWLVTEESMAAYRAMNDQFVLTGEELWGMEDEDSPTWQFLYGELSPKQYAKHLVAAFSEQS